MSARRPGRPLDTLTPRETEVLTLMAQGWSNAAIAAELVVSEGAVTQHTNRVCAKPGLPPDDADNRRVLAVLAFVRPD